MLALTWTEVRANGGGVTLLDMINCPEGDVTPPDTVVGSVTVVPLVL